MNDEKTQKNIIKQNQKIIDAVLVTKMMEHKGFGIFMKYLEEIENEYKFQDILGIKEGALEGQKGLVVGIGEVKNYFEKIKRRAEQPRKNPEDGELEKFKKNK